MNTINYVNLQSILKFPDQAKITYSRDEESNYISRLELKAITVEFVGIYFCISTTIAYSIDFDNDEYLQELEDDDDVILANYIFVNGMK